MKIRLEFKLVDCWIGAYWAHHDLVTVPIRHYDLWICVLPMLPIYVSWDRA